MAKFNGSKRKLQKKKKERKKIALSIMYKILAIKMNALESVLMR